MKNLVASPCEAPDPVASQTTLAVELARQGHQEMVVTGFPNAPSRVIAIASTMAANLSVPVVVPAG